MSALRRARERRDKTGVLARLLASPADLCKAVDEGDVESVEFAVQCGYEINNMHYNMYYRETLSVLIHACSARHPHFPNPDMVATILRLGGDPNYVSPGGHWCALVAIIRMYDSTWSHDQDHAHTCMRLIVNHPESDLNLRVRRNSTALMVAADYHLPSFIKLLLEAGANPLLVNDRGQTALDIYVENRQDHEDHEDDAPCIDMLQVSGLSP